VILALFEVKDDKKVSRQSESVRLELLSNKHAVCLLFSFEDALLAIPDGDGHVLVSITPDRTHNRIYELLGVESVTHIALRKVEHSVNRIILDVGEKSCLPQLRDKQVKRSRDGGLMFPVQPLAVHVSKKL
jgi:hypothetical protein